MHTLDVINFDWDEANRDKSTLKHDVSWLESEQVFFNEPLLVDPDPHHSVREQRYHALGMTHNGRLLFISFTIRKHLIRIISARPMSRAERREYEKRA